MNFIRKRLNYVTYSASKFFLKEIQTLYKDNNFEINLTKEIKKQKTEHIIYIT